MSPGYFIAVPIVFPHEDLCSVIMLEILTNLNPKPLNTGLSGVSRFRLFSLSILSGRGVTLQGANLGFRA